MTVGMTDCTMCVQHMLMSTFKSTGFVHVTLPLTIYDVVKACILSTCGANNRDLPSIFWQRNETNSISFQPFSSTLDMESGNNFFNKMIETMSGLRIKLTIISEVFPPETTSQRESFEKKRWSGVSGTVLEGKSLIS